VKQPHTCDTSEVRHFHTQCMTRFLGHQIMSIVWAQFDITVATLIEVIHGLTTYRSVTAKIRGQRSTYWLFCGEIGENRTQKYRDY
jgi:hypothetical protein